MHLVHDKRFSAYIIPHLQELQRRMVLGFNAIFFIFLKFFIFCFVVALCDLLHDEEAIFHVP